MGAVEVLRWIVERRPVAGLALLLIAAILGYYAAILHKSYRWVTTNCITKSDMQKAILELRLSMTHHYVQREEFEKLAEEVGELVTKEDFNRQIEKLENADRDIRKGMSRGASAG